MASSNELDFYVSSYVDSALFWTSHTNMWPGAWVIAMGSFACTTASQI